MAGKSFRNRKSWEQWITLKVITPSKYLGNVLKLLEGIESSNIETKYMSSDKVELVYETPLREIVSKNFYDKLKSTSQGFASMSYKFWGGERLIWLKWIFLFWESKKTLSQRLFPEKRLPKREEKLLKS